MGSELGSILRNKRREQKLTLRQLAEKTSIDYSMLSKYENGIVTPPREKVRIIAAALNIDEDTSLLNKNGAETGTSIVKRSVISKVNEDQYVMSDSVVKQIILEAANGTCELCGVEFPDVPNFLEIHYVVWLSNGGTPTIDNAVALCPNCHKRIHLLDDPSIREKLLAIAKAHI